MTIAQLHDAIEATLQFYQYKADMPVRIAARSYGPRIGGEETVGVASAYEGIDWDSGRFTIHADEPLYRGLDQLQAAANFAHQVREIIYGMHGDGRNKNANAVRCIEEALDQWLPDRHEKGGA